MVITKENIEAMNDKKFYFHDHILRRLEFERSTKSMQFKLETECGEKYTMECQDVIGFQMTACDFWGASLRILDFEYMHPEERMVLPQILEKYLSDNENQYMKLPLGDYIEVLMTFISGDQLRIACKKIDTGNTSMC